MPRSRIEGLLASFPKLTSAGQQHTTVETEAVRYVYQPLEDLYMILITNKQSNILQDIDTLHLFARVVSDTCRSNDEREILRHAFDLLSSFDEIVSLGYRENVNLAQIKSITEMESHEEKIQEIIARNKEQEAKDELKRRAKQLEMQRREMARRGPATPAFSSQSYNTPSFSTRSNQYDQVPVTTSFDNERPTPTPASLGKGRGMQLGKKQKTADLFEAVRGDMPEDVPLMAAPTQTSSLTAPVASAPVVEHDAIHIAINEKISMEANRDGGLENLEIKGDLQLSISDASVARLRLAVRATDDGTVKFMTHPNVDKKLFSADNIIALKDQARSFPVNQALAVLRWRLVTKDEASIPLSINCWPSPAGDGTSDVSIEYELESDEQELKDVTIAIPIPHGASPNVGSVDGQYEFNRANHTLEWQLPFIDGSNKSGSMEFNVEGEDQASFFPVQVAFRSERPLVDVDVLGVTSLESEEEVEFSKEVTVLTDEYMVV